MYKVILHLTVQKGIHLLGLEKVIDLPFVPFVGLYLAGLTNDEETGTIRIESVTWSGKEKAFFCELEDEIITSTKLEIKDVLEDYGDWEVLEPGN